MIISPRVNDIKQLPAFVQATDWQWRHAEIERKEFWIGVDPYGNEWLVKATGSFAAYREHVFNWVADLLNLSCQSSFYLEIPPTAEPRKKHYNLEPYQLALYLFDEHIPAHCSDECLLGLLHSQLDSSDDLAEVLEAATIKNITDWIRADYLADFFGANEPSGQLFTKEHQFIIVDNEQMFCTMPSGCITAQWIEKNNGEVSQAGRKILVDICEKLSRLTEADIKNALFVPPDFKVKKLWEIKPILLRGIEIAGQIINSI